LFARGGSHAGCFRILMQLFIENFLKSLVSLFRRFMLDYKKIAGRLDLQKEEEQ